MSALDEPVTQWSRARAAELVGLVDVTFPGERLSEDELVTLCFEDPDHSVVLGSTDGDAAIAVVARSATAGEHPDAFIQLLAVAPAQQDLGRGRALLASAEEWARAGGCRSLTGGAGAPYYLWPGIDVRWTAALALFEATGYAGRGAILNMSCPTTYRCAAPAGVMVTRVLEDADGDAVAHLCRRHWPRWEAEVRRAVDHGSCFIAADQAPRDAGSSVIGFACHSVNRVGWVGPMATVPDQRHGGVGAALLSALCADLRSAGLPEAEISWVGPIGFYARTAGASVSRVFRQVSKSLL
jgi:GNAT superfamily N-acetyltransferase